MVDNKKDLKKELDRLRESGEWDKQFKRLRWWRWMYLFAYHNGIWGCATIIINNRHWGFFLIHIFLMGVMLYLLKRDHYSYLFMKNIDMSMTMIDMKTTDEHLKSK